MIVTCLIFSLLIVTWQIFSQLNIINLIVLYINNLFQLSEIPPFIPACAIQTQLTVDQLSVSHLIVSHLIFGQLIVIQLVFSKMNVRQLIVESDD